MPPWSRLSVHFDADSLTQQLSLSLSLSLCLPSALTSTLRSQRKLLRDSEQGWGTFMGSAPGQRVCQGGRFARVAEAAAAAHLYNGHRRAERGHVHQHASPLELSTVDAFALPSEGAMPHNSLFSFRPFFFLLFFFFVAHRDSQSLSNKGFPAACIAAATVLFSLSAASLPSTIR